jgi:hypothetical protein
MGDIQVKKCVKCGVVKALNGFYSDRIKKDGKKNKAWTYK